MTILGLHDVVMVDMGIHKANRNIIKNNYSAQYTP